MKIKLSTLLIAPLFIFLFSLLVGCLICIAMLNWFEFLVIIVAFILLGLFFIGLELDSRDK